MKVVVAVFSMIILAASYSSCRPAHRRAGPTKVVAPPSPLALGSQGQLDGRIYRLRAHALVEIGEDGLMFDRHEYQLADEERNLALLIYGMTPRKKEWFLFTPVYPLEPMTPQQAAALRVGETVNVDGYIAPVSELIQSTVRQTESTDSPGEKSNSVFYGFAARSRSNILLVRWNEAGITFHRSKGLPVENATETFRAKAGN